MNLDKDKRWTDLNQHHKLTKISKTNVFFKKWYMTHSIDWMDGFNEGLELLLDYFEVKK